MPCSLFVDGTVQGDRTMSKTLFIRRDLLV